MRILLVFLFFFNLVTSQTFGQSVRQLIDNFPDPRTSVFSINEIQEILKTKTPEGYNFIRQLALNTNSYSHQILVLDALKGFDIPLRIDLSCSLLDNYFNNDVIVKLAIENLKELSISTDQDKKIKAQDCLLRGLASYLDSIEFLKSQKVFNQIVLSSKIKRGTNKTLFGGRLLKILGSYSRRYIVQKYFEALVKFSTQPALNAFALYAIMDDEPNIVVSALKELSSANDPLFPFLAFESLSLLQKFSTVSPYFKTYDFSKADHSLITDDSISKLVYYYINGSDQNSVIDVFNIFDKRDISDAIFKSIDDPNTRVSRYNFKYVTFLFEKLISTGSSSKAGLIKRLENYLSGRISSPDRYLDVRVESFKVFLNLSKKGMYNTSKLVDILVNASLKANSTDDLWSNFSNLYSSKVNSYDIDSRKRIVTGFLQGLSKVPNFDRRSTSSLMTGLIKEFNILNPDSSKINFFQLISNVNSNTAERYLIDDYYNLLKPFLTGDQILDYHLGALQGKIQFKHFEYISQEHLVTDSFKEINLVNQSVKRDLSKDMISILVNSSKYAVKASNIITRYNNAKSWIRPNEKVNFVLSVLSGQVKSQLSKEEFQTFSMLKWAKEEISENSTQLGLNLINQVSDLNSKPYLQAEIISIILKNSEFMASLEKQYLSKKNINSISIEGSTLNSETNQLVAFHLLSNSSNGKVFKTLFKEVNNWSKVIKSYRKSNDSKDASHYTEAISSLHLLTLTLSHNLSKPALKILEKMNTVPTRSVRSRSRAVQLLHQFALESDENKRSKIYSEFREAWVSVSPENSNYQGDKSYRSSGFRTSKYLYDSINKYSRLANEKRYFEARILFYSIFDTLGDVGKGGLGRPIYNWR